MDGVYYETSDYAGIVRRIVIMIIDSIFLGIIFDISYSAAQLVNVMDGHVILGFLALTYIYLVLLKRSKYRTIAYRIVDAKIVDLKGNMPSIWKMTLRYLLLLEGHFIF